MTVFVTVEVIRGPSTSSLDRLLLPLMLSRPGVAEANTHNIKTLGEGIALKNIVRTLGGKTDSISICKWRRYTCTADRYIHAGSSFSRAAIASDLETCGRDFKRQHYTFTFWNHSSIPAHTHSESLLNLAMFGDVRIQHQRALRLRRGHFLLGIRHQPFIDVAYHHVGSDKQKYLRNGSTETTTGAGYDNWPFSG
jgi:hypothetical protein